MSAETLLRKDGKPDGRCRRRLPCAACGGARPGGLYLHTKSKAIPTCYRCRRLSRKIMPFVHALRVREAMQSRAVIEKNQRAALARYNGPRDEGESR